jgi:hypothetical protein
MMTMPGLGTNSIRTLRTQLALLYMAVLVALGAALLVASGLLVTSSSVSISGVHNSQSVLADHRFQTGPALVFAAAVLVALALGWFIAGRFLRPLRTITASAKDAAQQR